MSTLIDTRHADLIFCVVLHSRSTAHLGLNRRERTMIGAGCERDSTKTGAIALKNTACPPAYFGEPPVLPMRLWTSVAKGVFGFRSAFARGIAGLGRQLKSSILPRPTRILVSATDIPSEANSRAVEASHDFPCCTPITLPEGRFVPARCLPLTCNSVASQICVFFAALIEHLVKAVRVVLTSQRRW